MNLNNTVRDGSRTTATSKMERFVVIISGLKPLTIITKHSILDVAAVLDPPLNGIILTPFISKFLRKSNNYVISIGRFYYLKGKVSEILLLLLSDNDSYF